MTSPDPAADPATAVEATDAAVDRWVADAEAMAARYQQLATNVERVTVSETTPDGLITVTVNSGGLLTDLKISDRAAAAMPGSRIGAGVLWAMRRAQSRISAQVAEVMKTTLGGQDEAMEEAVLSRYRETFPEPVEQVTARPPAVEEQRIGHDESPSQAQPPVPQRAPARTAPPRRAAADDWDGGESFLEEVDR